MSQPDHADATEQGAEHAFDAGEVIIGHIANSAPEHPILYLPAIAGIDFSISKHVFMLFVVATALFFLITLTVRRYLSQDRLIPFGLMNGLEFVVEFVRDSIVLPNVGPKWVKTFAPLGLTFFFFILGANVVGLIPIFEVLGLIDHTILHTGEHSVVKNIIHGGTTATANFNVTAALATITFISIIVAGTMAHGFIQHWVNLVPHGLAWPLYILLIPIEVMGMFVKPFALTMRLAANMAGGHIAILAIFSFVFIFSALF